MKTFFVLLLILSFQLTAFGQGGTWETYIAEFDEGPGSVLLNMDLINESPKRGYTFVLITGVTTPKCNEYGFPLKEAFEFLYEISDGVGQVVDNNAGAILAGTFTHKCVRLDYYYLNDTTQIRKSLSEWYQSNAGGYDYTITIKPDRAWRAYREFLFPNELIQETIKNAKIITALNKEGDTLKQRRHVDHWIYFPNEKSMEQFSAFAKSLNFKVKKSKSDQSDYPLVLVISRKELVENKGISELTLSLRNKANELGGDYDGWETVLILDH